MKTNEIKICGIADLTIANFCIDNGADYLGFVSYENSPRNISFKDSKNIIARLLKPTNKILSGPYSNLMSFKIFLRRDLSANLSMVLSMPPSLTHSGNWTCNPVDEAG